MSKNCYQCTVTPSFLLRESAMPSLHCRCQPQNWGEVSGTLRPFPVYSLLRQIKLQQRGVKIAFVYFQRGQNCSVSKLYEEKYLWLECCTQSVYSPKKTTRDCSQSQAARIFIAGLNLDPRPNVEREPRGGLGAVFYSQQ